MKDAYIILGAHALAFLILGIVFLAMYSRRAKKFNVWSLTTGEIIKKDITINISIGSLINKDSKGSKLPDRAPTVSYQVGDVSYEYTSKIQQSPGLPPGKIVEVFYNPDNPQEAIINTFVQRGSIFKLLGSIFIGICAIFVLIITGLFLLN